MPSITFLTSAETELKEPGYGGRPPFDDSPEDRGGGGDDDSHDPWYGPRELLHRMRFFTISALAADLVFFAVLVMLYYAHQNASAGSAQERPILLPPLLFLNATLLLLSVTAMELARRNIFREIDVLEEWLGLGRPALKRTLPWLGVTFALGALFLAGQWITWRQLTTLGFAFSRSAASTSHYFYLLIGIHAAHLAVGLGALLFCMVALGRLNRVELRQIAVDLSAWCWYSFSGAWMVLLLVLATS